MTVTRQSRYFTQPRNGEFYSRMLNWMQQFGIFCLLDNCGYQHNAFPLVAAAGAVQAFEARPGHCFSTLEEAEAINDWLFGHIGYDCKNEVEQLQSHLPDHTGFPPLFFFQPEHIIWIDDEGVRISSLTQDPVDVFGAIINSPASGHTPVSINKLKLNSRFSKEEYTHTIEQLKQHIHRGDCYEINLCQEFFAEEATIDPLAAYLSLTGSSPNPFSAFYKIDDKYLVCASPERFLQKKGNRLVSQPIKGTLKRTKHDDCSDERERTALQNDPKERSENIMVVDLVRNDLSKICDRGSVQVTELCGAYTFPHVHHLISTVTGTVAAETGVAQITRALFPMGSMTGAPKKKVMELTERYEKTKRGIFSGAVGYMAPDKDFDFNVVIRSMMYNQTSKYLSCLAGGGITFYCNAEQEYEESLLKAAAIEKMLGEN